MPQRVSRPNPQQMNALIRSAVLAQAVRVRQPIFNSAWTPSQQVTLNIQPKYIGLVRRFTVVITGQVKNNDGANAATLTDAGLANLLDFNQGVVLTDLNGYNRIQTGLWHMLIVDSVKRQKPFGTKFTPEAGTPWQTDGAWQPYQQPSATLAAGATSSFRLQFDIPVCYAPDDLRGAIWLSVVNATMQLALTINNSLVVASTADSTQAMYTIAAASVANVALQNLNVAVYQDYLDQLPAGQGGQPALPMLDLATVYELKKSQVPNIAQAVENPLPYTSLRRFLSTTAIYDSAPAAAAGSNRFAGSDVSYWALQTASQLYLWRLDPQMFANEVREMIGWDLPAGYYHFSHRRQPIYTPTSGNIQLLLNPITANAGAIVHLGYEDFADVNLITQAPSIPGAA